MKANMADRRKCCKESEIIYNIRVCIAVVLMLLLLDVNTI